MQRILILFFCCSGSFILKAQEWVYPGNFRCISLNGPVMNYFQDSSILKKFTRDLDSLILLKKGYRLKTDQPIIFDNLSNNQSEEKNPVVNKAFPCIYMDLVEYTPVSYIQKYNQFINDSVFRKEVISVFSFQLAIRLNENDFAFNKLLDIFIKRGAGNGMGMTIQNIVLTPKGFNDLLKKSLVILLDSSDNYEQIEMHASPAYTGDNFILEKTAGLPRINVYSNKKLSRFDYDNQEQIIRWGEQEYREIHLKGKNKTILSDSLMSSIQQTESPSDFVFLLQEGRDVISDKNYIIILPAGIRKYYNQSQNEPVFDLIKGPFHSLLCGNDTVALFSVTRGGTDPEKKLLLHQVSNGINKESITAINKNESVIDVHYLYIIEGKMFNHAFRILISNFLKEIYIDGQLRLIVQGEKAPERFVTFGNNIPAEMINALLIIGYNSFLN